MTEIPLTQLHRVHMEPSCTAGACQQGRKPCPCPQACQQPEPELAVSAARTAYILIVSAAICAAGAMALFS